MRLFYSFTVIVALLLVATATHAAPLRVTDANIDDFYQPYSDKREVCHYASEAKKSSLGIIKSLPLEVGALWRKVAFKKTRKQKKKYRKGIRRKAKQVSQTQKRVDTLLEQGRQASSAYTKLFNKLKRLEIKLSTLRSKREKLLAAILACKAFVPGQPLPIPPTPTATPTPTPTPSIPIPETPDYFVCNCGTGADSDCVAGSDSNSGTLTSPFQTFEKARTQFNLLQAGETIGLCSGGVFEVTSGTRLVNENCQADKRCTIRDYTPTWASGDEGKPIINSPSTSVFSLEDGGAPNHEEGYIIANLELHGGGSGNGVFIYNDIDDVLLYGLVIDSFHIGVHCAGSNSDPEAGSDGLNERIVLSNSTIRNSDGQGWLGGCTDCVVDSNTFINNGFGKAVFNHNVYWSGATQRGKITNNDLYQSALIDGECKGVSLVTHGKHSDLLIENNTVREDVGAAGQGCWGIAIDGGGGSGEVYDGLIIRGNTVVNVGNLGIGCTSCQNAIIENNIVIHEQAFGNTAIGVPSKSSSSGDLPTTNVTVRNNTIYNKNAGGRGITLGTYEGEHFTLVSNAIYYAGVDNSFDCLRVDRPEASYRAIDHNLCYFPNATAEIEWVNGKGSTPDPLTAWQQNSPFGDNSLNTDPLFKDPSLWDFSIASSTSAVIDAGHATLSASQDILGITRSTPDIGAYEYNN
ncbi:hypothetical protein OAO01_08160 [Oligoflexia bacterium]|nr:hypothetical protein [Oligoflexia bacterium]